MRLDKYLAEKYPAFSRSQLNKLVKDGQILVNGEKAKPSMNVNHKDQIFVPEISSEPEVVVLPMDLNLEVVYEDKACLVVNKPAGISVHPGAGYKGEATLVSGILERIQVDQFNDKIRPGIVHRLDKDTSGLIVIAKDRKASENIVEQFKNRQVEKNYIALVFDFFQHKEGLVEASIERSARDRKKMRLSESGGKTALSKYRVVKEYSLDDGVRVSLVDVEIKTGRTHQIRVHMAGIGHAVIGDPKYGNKKVNQWFERKYGLKRQFLHAAKLKFRSPDTGEIVNLEVDLPEELTFLPSW